MSTCHRNPKLSTGGAVLSRMPREAKGINTHTGPQAHRDRGPLQTQPDPSCGKRQMLKEQRREQNKEDMDSTMRIKLKIIETFKKNFRKNFKIHKRE